MRTHHLLPAALALVLALTSLLPLSLAPPAPAQADEAAPRQALNITLLGDSYSAGNGAGAYEPEDPDDPHGKAYRSRNNWAQHYTRWLNEQGVHAVLTNVSHSGAVTNDLLNGQIEQMPTDTDLAMFTIGGNDVEFAKIVQSCFAVGFRSPSSCEQSVTAAETGLSKVKEQTLGILEDIDARLDDDAEVVLVGYPYLATDDRYILSTTTPTGDTTYDAGSGVRGLSDKAKEIQSSLVAEWNAAHPSLQVTYVDGVINAFTGHEPDPSAASRNDYRWINEFLETEGRVGDDGKTTSSFSHDNLMFYHPNLIGHRQIAQLIADTVGIPSSTKPISPTTSEDIDVVFAIDSTGSMADDAAAVASNMQSIMDTTQRTASSYRFALVDYKDHPQYDPANYLARTDVDFTTDSTAIADGLNSLTFDGGNLGNTHASVYSGVMEGIGLQWRDGVRKILVVIGDAPPRDPEPGTGYTAASVAKAAYEVDPVSVYGIDTGGSLDSQDFSSLVTGSGGTTARSDSPDDVVELINAAVSNEVSKPFAWIQGGYVIKVGSSLTIDASESDNCPDIANWGQNDYDGDGIGDECDPDPGYPTEDLPGVTEETDSTSTPTPEPSGDPAAPGTAQPSDPAAPTSPADPAGGSDPGTGQQASDPAGTSTGAATQSPGRVAQTGAATLGPLVLVVLSLAGGALALRGRRRSTRR